MKTSSQLIEGRRNPAQPGHSLHYPDRIRALGRGRARYPGRIRARAGGRPRFLGTPAPCHFLGKRKDLGDDLLFQTVASPVPSALTGLTAVFGMGTGVSPSLWSPKSLSFSFDRCKESSLGTAQITRSTSCANER